MKKPNLPSGTTVYSGKAHFDNEDHLFHLRVRPFQSGRSIVPKDAIPTLHALGLRISPHWKPTIARLGHMASFDVEYYDGPGTVDPWIQAMLNNKLTNTHSKHLLEEDY